MSSPCVAACRHGLSYPAWSRIEAEQDVSKRLEIAARALSVCEYAVESHPCTLEKSFDAVEAHFRGGVLTRLGPLAPYVDVVDGWIEDLYGTPRMVLPDEALFVRACVVYEAARLCGMHRPVAASALINLCSGVAYWRASVSVAVTLLRHSYTVHRAMVEDALWSVPYANGAHA